MTWSPWNFPHPKLPKLVVRVLARQAKVVNDSRLTVTFQAKCLKTFEDPAASLAAGHITCRLFRRIETQESPRITGEAGTTIRFGHGDRCLRLAKELGAAIPSPHAATN